MVNMNQIKVVWKKEEIIRAYDSKTPTQMNGSSRFGYIIISNVIKGLGNKHSSI